MRKGKKNTSFKNIPNSLRGSETSGENRVSIGGFEVKTGGGETEFLPSF